VPVRDSFEWLRTGDVFGLRTPIVILFLVLILSAVVMRYTRFGRQVYALGSAEEASYLAGLPTRRTKIVVYMISSTLVAIAGLILMARIGSGDPRSGGGLELKAIAAVVLGGATLSGGRGTPIGSFLGVFVLGVVQAALTFLNINDSWSDFVFGGVLIVAVLITAVSDLRRDNKGQRSLLAQIFSMRGAATAPVQPAESTDIQQPQENT
jgi:ribose/xylose/arabinose/galactoside ABC-type transport system permease subunit